MISATTGKQAMLSLERIPVLSPVATQLLGRLARRNCETRELAALIERDSLLSAQILAIANSAAFGRTQQINFINHAIKIAPSFSITRFNLHAVATGMFLELLAEYVPLKDPEEAFWRACSTMSESW